MHIASEHGFDGILAYLYKELNLNLNETDINKRTPLHLAALNGNITTAMFLIA